MKPWLQLIDIGNPELYYPTNMCPPTNGRQSADIQLIVLQVCRVAVGEVLVWCCMVKYVSYFCLLIHYPEKKR